MARYEMRPVGVYDRALDREVRRGDLEWPKYEAWLIAGGVCDPLPAPPLPPIQERRAEIAARVNGERADVLRRATAAVGADVYDADPPTVARLALAIALGVRSLKWRTRDNRIVTLTGEQLAEVGRAVFERIEEIYWRSWELKDAAIAASTEPEAIDISRGWGRDDPPPRDKPQPEGPLERPLSLSNDQRGGSRQ